MSQYCQKCGIENGEVSSNVKRVIFMKILMVAILMVVSAQAGQTSLTMVIPAGKYGCMALNNENLVFEQKLILSKNKAVDANNHQTYTAQSRINNHNEVFYAITEPLIGIMIYPNDRRVDKQGDSYYGARFVVYPSITSKNYSATYLGRCYLLK